MNGPREGRCLGGAVGFVVEGELDFVAHCHSRSCRLAHAAAYVTWTSVPRERVAFTRRKTDELLAAPGHAAPPASGD